MEWLGINQSVKCQRTILLTGRGVQYAPVIFPIKRYMMKKILYLIFGIAIISACADKGENAQKSGAISQCLEDNDYQYEKLLTKADIAKYVNIDESSFKKEIAPTKGKYGFCTYSWESGRPKLEKVIAGHDMKLPDPNQVTIKLLDFYTDKDLEIYEQESAIDLFDMGYKKLSQDEYNELLANLEKKLGDKPEDLARAKKMMQSRMNFTYKPIDNLGDRAYWKWNDYGIELVVLTGKARFTIVSKTTGESETSLEHAVNFAKEVLAKCKG